MAPTWTSLSCGAMLWLAAAAAPALAADPAEIPDPVVDGATLPPPIGPSEPRVVPDKGEDGLYHQSWFPQSFLDVAEEHATAKAEGKRFAIFFEQRGSIHCLKMHKTVLARRYINDYVRRNFHVVQMDIWGNREAKDFDGKTLTEQKLAERWGVIFTPTVIFFKDIIADRHWGRDLEVTRMSLGIGPGTFYDMFVWIREKIYATNANFQLFHIQRYHEREALRAEAAGGDGGASRPKTN